VLFYEVRKIGTGDRLHGLGTVSFLVDSDEPSASDFDGSADKADHPEKRKLR
jgi:hypothetical protein